jgi:hypothetical protein
VAGTLPYGENSQGAGSGLNRLPPSSSGFGFSGGGFSGSSGLFGQQQNTRSPFGSGGLGGESYGPSGNFSGGRVPATEKQLHDALQRIKELEERLDRYEKKSKTDTKGVEWNAPPENLQGIVQQVSKEGHIVVSLGSEKGLQPGHTLEVYRLKPKPTYLGRIKIEHVQPAASIAKLLTQINELAIQEGDHVTDSLIQK